MEDNQTAVSIRYLAIFLSQVANNDDNLIYRYSMLTLLVINIPKHSTYSEENIHHDLESIQVSYTDTLCTTGRRD